MARLVIHTETSPIAIAKDSVPGTHIHVCRCGLSRNLPFCDGTHKITRAEGPNALLRYTETDGRLEATPVDLPAAATEVDPS